jgi:tRNA threonylcarbamoyladenosine biosynthesis protein TsaB
MIVLGCDTSTPATAIGLRLHDGATLRARDDPEHGQRPGHATRLLPLAADLLAQAGLRFADVDRIAVGVGPGTFTGLRIGVASARGLAQSLDIELIAVSSPQALAQAASGEGEEVEGCRGVLAVIDARRGEAFAAAYAPADLAPVVDGRQLPPRAPRELAPARTLAPESFAAILDEAAAQGESPASWLALGNGAVLYRDALQTLGIKVPPEQSPLHRIDGAAICALGSIGVAQGIDTVLPDYRRRPDAELALDRSAAHGAGTGTGAGAGAGAGVEMGVGGGT